MRRMRGEHGTEGEVRRIPVSPPSSAQCFLLDHALSRIFRPSRVPLRPSGSCRTDIRPMTRPDRITTPEIITEWLDEKVTAHVWASVLEERVVSHEWRRQLGGRTMSAALTVAVAPADNFSIAVRAGGTDSEYVAAAKNGVITTLMSQAHVAVLACSIELSGFRDQGQDSSYAAFFMVAKEATERLLGVHADFAHNIAWSGRQGEMTAP